MSPLPENYPSPLHLPFNRQCLEGSLQMATSAEDPGGEGAWVLLRGSELLMTSVAGSPELPAGPLPAGLVDETREPVYIGSWQGRPCRALRLSRQQELPAGLEAHNLLATQPLLAIEQLSLGGLAGQILHWKSNSGFCSKCGAPTDPLPGEWGRKCRMCGYSHFPHIHPCVIVIVRRPGQVLLTRKAEWPEGRYSLVAGFVDFGECLEEAVAREVREETGVRVQNVRYLGSQSWPFPSQLMTGFTAEYLDGEVVVEEKELEDARWFDVDRLPTLPPKRSIARYLIDNFCRI
ncbi:NADH pyrophosphatase [Desulfuromonas versatilis]|uniref:NAD(+) diphosphatase n=1 Tax=Desulfuromonas versatilis TaxID=2802975 RepID=A0ABN6E2F1_9BACT|nr:NAD(+) diphosphatase [Desulfuromonas versatilis]BCR06344.1 NADH pyrophosphatase [Desulfuromonas versatilis]